MANHSGFEVRTEGDGCMIAFGSSRDRLDFAIAARRALVALTPQPPLPRGEGAPEGAAEAPAPLAPSGGEGPGVRGRMGVRVGEVVAEGSDDRADLGVATTSPWPLASPRRPRAARC